MARTAHIVPNALLDVPDPNVSIMRRCAVFPVEFVVRGFMTGVRTAPSTCLMNYFPNHALIVQAAPFINLELQQSLKPNSVQLTVHWQLCGLEDNVPRHTACQKRHAMFVLLTQPS